MFEMFENLAVLAAYILLNVYVIRHTHRWVEQGLLLPLKHKRTLKVILAFVLAGAASMLIIWLPMPKNALSLAIVRAGNFWLGFLMQFAALLLIYDIGRFLWTKVLHIQKGMPPFWRGLTIVTLSILLMVQGLFNATNIRVCTYDVSVDKPAKQDLTVVLASDMHMGYSIGTKQMRNVVEKINEQNADVVVLAGDLYDNNFDSVQDPETMKEIYRSIQSKYGTYAVYGNHDVIATLVGGFTVGGSRIRDPRMEQFLIDSNIHVMKDDVVEIEGVTFVGRIDGEETGDHLPRKELGALLTGVDKTKPLIVINHEPAKLKEYDEQNVDVLLSGHTHNGQTFPICIATKFWFENSFGLKKVGNLTSIVTAGVGVYGPFMRTFVNPDITVVRFHFQTDGSTSKAK